MEEQENRSEESQSGENGDAANEHKLTGPFAIQFAPNAIIWQEARKLISDKNIRVEDLATCCAQDPVLVIELLKSANAMFFSVGRSPITSAKVAIVRLGSDTVLSIFEKINERVQVDDEDVLHWIEHHRSRCQRTSIIARVFAEAIARTLADDAQAAGLLLNIGEMLATQHLGRQYVELAEELKRSGVNYRLSNDFKFDVEKMGATYLRRNGIPEALLFAIDRDAMNRSQERAVLRPLVQAASELVEAFDNNRWEKLAPGKNLPSKSAIRLLQLDEGQYLKIYERASEYLFSARLLEEKNKQKAISNNFDDNSSPIAVGLSSVQEALQDEIFDLLGGGSEEKSEQKENAPTSNAVRPSTQITEIQAELIDPSDQFKLSPKNKAEKTAPRANKPAQQIVAPALATRGKGTKIVSDLANLIEDASSSEEVITNILAKLVDQGPFEKTALIVVSKDRKNAIVVASRGPGMGNGLKLELKDPLSPLAKCFSKVQSFGNKSNEASPFGSKAFALSPIDADHETPVALYADCGNDASITFEARRIFRTVVDILNRRLPSLPGGIPVELK
ncbi:MAG: HDOD domain-containing protein [Bdellovibrionales bacterium]|nr:HDOD domain-containing protein [Bdellovibrionales bacterium]